MAGRGHNRHGPQRVGAAVPLSRRWELSPRLAQCHQQQWSTFWRIFLCKISLSVYTLPIRHTEISAVLLLPVFPLHCAITGSVHAAFILYSIGRIHSRKWTFCDRELWPVTLTFQTDWYRIKMIHYTKYPHQRSFSSEVIFWTHIHLTDVSTGLLKWSVNILLANVLTYNQSTNQNRFLKCHKSRANWKHDTVW